MKDLSYLSLADVYGKALTDKQRDMLADYYERDFSLSEIADNAGVSRQAVHFAVKQAQDSLTKWERDFGFLAFLQGLQPLWAALKAKAGAQASEQIAETEEYIRRFYGTVWQP